MSRDYKNPRDVPDEVLAARLDELSTTLSQRSRHSDWQREFTIRIPAECDRDADIVMSEAARRLRASRKAVGGE